MHSVTTRGRIQDNSTPPAAKGFNTARATEMARGQVAVKAPCRDFRDGEFERIASNAVP